MKLSFGPWGETLHEFVEAGIDAEKKGFETLWTSELHRTPFVPLTALATKTSTIKLGSGVALAFLRSPLTLALTAMDLNEISNGRFILGLGSGVKNLNEYWHDVRFGKPVKHIEDVINICRMVIKESHLNPIKYEGSEKSISLVGFDRPFTPKETSIPIYMGSVGPFMTRKCGEIADGWISHELCSPQYLESNIKVAELLGYDASKEGTPASQILEYFDMQNLFDDMELAIRNPIEARLKFSNKLSNQFKANSIDGFSDIDIMITWWRDMMMIMLDNEKSVININRLNTLKDLTTNFKLDQVISIIKMFHSAKSYLNMNTNPLLVYDNLFINIPLCHVSSHH